MPTSATGEGVGVGVRVGMGVRVDLGVPVEDGSDMGATVGDGDTSTVVGGSPPQAAADSAMATSAARAPFGRTMRAKGAKPVLTAVRKPAMCQVEVASLKNIYLLGTDRMTRKDIRRG